ncbi:MAG: hypothetical protein JWQ74_2508 [Marmoricola sp.]|nr:hypothetical protein [Marmoricola sp.]
MDSWRVRAPRPPALVHPAPIDPAGESGPTRGQACGPRWRRTSTGLYVGSQVDRTLVEQRILEESGRLPAGGAVGGWAALRLHGVGYLDGLAADGQALLPVPLVVPPGTPLRSVDGVVVHRNPLPRDDRAVRHGVPVTAPARSAFDAARWAGDWRGAVVALDLALAAGVVARPALTRYVAEQRGRPGARAVTRALALTDDRSMSPKETALRLIWVLDAGLPRPRCNWPVADEDGNLIGRPDLLSEEHAVVGEFDGAQHRSRSRHRDDLRRDDAFRAVGLEPFRVVGADLDDVPLVLARIGAAIARTETSNVPRTWRLRANPRPVA